MSNIAVRSLYTTITTTAGRIGTCPRPSSSRTDRGWDGPGKACYARAAGRRRPTRRYIAGQTFYGAESVPPGRLTFRSGSDGASCYRRAAYDWTVAVYASTARGVRVGRARGRGAGKIDANQSGTGVRDKSLPSSTSGLVRGNRRRRGKTVRAGCGGENIRAAVFAARPSVRPSVRHRRRRRRLITKYVQAFFLSFLPSFRPSFLPSFRPFLPTFIPYRLFH